MSSFDLFEAQALLARTPQALRALLSSLPEALLESRENPEAWSVREVLAHLVFGKTTDWMARLRILLEQGEERPFEPFDRDGHKPLARQPVAELLDRFAQLRAKNLEQLRNLHLEESDLDRCGRHPKLGTVTLRQLLATWTVHDLNHLDQVARTLAHRYGPDTGPWNRPEFLGILHRREVPAQQERQA